MKGVQCYELFGGIALKNHTFSFFLRGNPLTRYRSICMQLFCVRGVDNGGHFDMMILNIK